jgi:ABC-type transport system substrate-binding protein
MGSAVALFISALTLQHCTSKPTSATSTAATPAAPSLDSSLAPTLSVKELMEHIIDPTADWIFDAAVIDISHKGITETKPLNDEDWLKVERGGWLLAESTNLLKIPRRMVPAEDEGKPHQAGDPELSPDQIQAKIEKDRALWYKYADGLKAAGLEAVRIAKARDLEGLFKAGDVVDKACEACHLEYWYPGDREAVTKDQNSKVTYDPPKKK